MLTLHSITIYSRLVLVLPQNLLGTQILDEVVRLEHHSGVLAGRGGRNRHFSAVRHGDTQRSDHRAQLSHSQLLVTVTYRGIERQADSESLY